MTSFQLVYGHEAVVSAKITVPSLRVEKQKELSANEYSELMNEEMEETPETRLLALNHLQAYQSRVCGAYNKKVRAKSFAVDDLVLKLLFPIDQKDRVYGKWSSNWEGPFQISRITKGNAYYLKNKDGLESEKPVNGKYLKKDAVYKVEKVVPEVSSLLLSWTSIDLAVEVDAGRYGLELIRLQLILP
ncbi:uncharacterized protein LOC109704554 [Ananas comosus]|uniref:Uncharacterized protein LOC109704554 n=1 Tax=Ananas comosus TaxID=4615 RepID=A0A6P5ECI2_ANACO|nr:uncharacterized protein LOC109704554 [Ananas comosus]